MIRYIKRFIGTKKSAKYAIILQQWQVNQWVDVDMNGTWETPEQQLQYEQAVNWEEVNLYRR